MDAKTNEILERKVPFGVSMKLKTCTEIDQEAKERGMTRSEYVEKIFEERRNSLKQKTEPEDGEK